MQMVETQETHAPVRERSAEDLLEMTSESGPVEVQDIEVIPGGSAPSDPDRAPAPVPRQKLLAFRVEVRPFRTGERRKGEPRKESGGADGGEVTPLDDGSVVLPDDYIVERNLEKPEMFQGRGQ